MYIKFIDDKPSPLIGDKIAYNGRVVEIDDKFRDKLKKRIDKGEEFLIRDGDKWIDGKKYFKTTINSDIKVKKSEDFEDLFKGHWKTKVKNVKEYTENPNLVKNILDYAKENNVVGAVIDRIEKYLEELEE